MTIRGHGSTSTFGVRRSAATLRVGLMLLVVVAIFAVAAAIRWQSTLTFLGEFLVDSQPPQYSDLIVVLGGGFWGPRVITGAELAKQRFAPMALMSGPPYHGRPQGELAIDFLVKQGYSRGLFQVFATEAQSTIAEANDLRAELARRHVRRVLLVTSDYHSRRATIVMSLFCPGVSFISVPAPDPHYHVAEWWNDESSRHLFFSEWSKILGSVLVAYPAHTVSRLLGGGFAVMLGGRGATWLRRGASAHSGSSSSSALWRLAPKPKAALTSHGRRVP